MKTIRGIGVPANAEGDGKKLASRRKFAALRQRRMPASDASVGDLDLHAVASTAASWRILPMAAGSPGMRTC